MKKFIFFLFVILGNFSLNAGGYLGIDYSIGISNDFIELDGVEMDDSDTCSYMGYGIHGGYINLSNNRYELYYNKLMLSDDVTTFGFDYIYTVGSDGFVPYLGGGLFYVIMDDVKFSNGDSFEGIGYKMRGGAFIKIEKNLELGIEFNYSSISWNRMKVYNYSSSYEINYSTLFYGLGLNLNYKF